MKKITLLVASILLVGSVANASEIIKNSGEEKRNSYSFDEPISFTERGIEFFVFPNGDFDFNTRPDDSQGDYFYKTAGKRGTVTTEKRNGNYGVRIEQDSYGRVRRVGNTFINYDSRDRVSRIGTVYMKYNRTALAQIGGMRIVYNRRGEIVDTLETLKVIADMHALITIITMLLITLHQTIIMTITTIIKLMVQKLKLKTIKKNKLG